MSSTSIANHKYLYRESRIKLDDNNLSIPFFLQLVEALWHSSNFVCMKQHREWKVNIAKVIFLDEYYMEVVLLLHYPLFSLIMHNCSLAAPLTAITYLLIRRNYKEIIKTLHVSFWTKISFLSVYPN